MRIGCGYGQPHPKTPAGSILGKARRCDRARIKVTKEEPMSATAITSNWVELADRAGDGLEVRLYWNSDDGRVKVTVTHLATDRVGELDVAPTDAMEAFHHPFAYQRTTIERRRLLAAA
jgi:hypothetical protein